MDKETSYKMYLKGKFADATSDEPQEKADDDNEVVA